MAEYDFAAARAHVETMIGYRFSNKDLLQEALHAGGPIIIGNKYINEGNERLAMIGQHALSLSHCISDYKSRMSRGYMSVRRSSLTSNEHLSRIGIDKGIDSCIRLNGKNQPIGPYTRATTMEAIFGAVYLDAGDFEAVRRCVTALGH